MIKSILIPVACLACGVAAALTCAQEDPAATVQVSVKVVPKETLPGLPVAVLVTLENRSSQPVLVPVTVTLMERTLRITVEGPEGVQRKVTPRFISTRHSPYGQIPLASSASVRHKEWAGTSVEGPHFPTAGRYVVKAEVEMSEGAWRKLAPAEVLVREPEGAEAEAFRLFPRESETIDIRGSYVAVNPLKVEEILPRLERLEREYSDTPYGQYARFVLALRKVDDADAAGRPGHKLLSAKQIAARRYAVDLLVRLESEGAPEAIRHEIGIELVRYYLRLGELEKAAARLDLLDREDLPKPLLRIRSALRTTLSKRLLEDEKEP